MFEVVYHEEGKIYKTIDFPAHIPYVKINGYFVKNTGKFYCQPHQQQFKSYLKDYDVAVLGYIRHVGVDRDGTVEFFFDPSERFELVGTYYGLPYPIPLIAWRTKNAGDYPTWGNRIASIKFDSNKKPYKYKLYSTSEVTNWHPQLKIIAYEQDQEVEAIKLYAQLDPDIGHTGFCWYGEKSDGGFTEIDRINQMMLTITDGDLIREVDIAARRITYSDGREEVLQQHKPDGFDGTRDYDYYGVVTGGNETQYRSYHGRARRSSAEKELTMDGEIEDIVRDPIKMAEAFDWG